MFHLYRVDCLHPLWDAHVPLWIGISDGIADTVGGETLEGLLHKVTKGGTIASVVGASSGAAALGLVVRAMWAHADAARLTALAGAVAAGELVIPIARRLPLAEAREAQRIAEHHAGGKVLLLA